jgi:copper(I)-binding protein
VLKISSLIITLLALTACSADDNHRIDPQQSASGVIEISHARARTSRPPHANSAAFMTIENHGDHDLVIVGVKSNRAKIGELHTMLNEDDKMKMRRVEKLVVPSDGELVLKPGSDHFMFFGIDKEWRVGDQVELTLLFAKAPEQVVALEVENL